MIIFHKEEEHIMMPPDGEEPLLPLGPSMGVGIWVTGNVGTFVGLCVGSSVHKD